ncbi:MAG: uracil-DNA glycosylase family protein [Hyphomicrobiaceae bacterium]|nr:uracil-DNA glycosylase family protein [Hyphomicrobiaceae bacterium]
MSASHCPAALDRLVSDIRACRLCQHAPKGRPLPHEPNPIVQLSASARLLIAGQAPGARAHAAGRPFADPSGVRLRGWLAVDEATFYDARRVAIAPMGFCFPGTDARGADLPPRPQCADRWRGELLATLPRVELVLAVGRSAIDWHLPAARVRRLAELVRDWRAILGAGSRPRCLPLPHPSWRNNAWLRDHPWFEEEVVPGLRREVRALL